MKILCILDYQPSQWQSTNCYPVSKRNCHFCAKSNFLKSLQCVKRSQRKSNYTFAYAKLSIRGYKRYSLIAGLLLIDNHGYKLTLDTARIVCDRVYKTAR